MASVGKFTKRYSTFRPTNISGCRSWMDTMDASSYTLSGTSVLTVTDKADNNTFTKTGSIVSKYNGSDKTTSGFDMTIGNLKKTITSMPLYVHTAFFVTKLDSYPTTAGSPCMSFASSTSGSSQFHRPLDYATTFRTVAFGQSVIVAAASGATTNSMIFSGTYSNKVISSRYFDAGTENSYGTTGSSDYNTDASVVLIGADGATGQTGVFSWPGTVREVIVYGSVLSDTERRTVEGYLAWKWGLQSILSSTHPYKNVPFYTYT